MPSDVSTGIVYVLTNPSMPGLVKIGKTSRESIEPRLNELYSTGIPVPFECAYAARVSDEHTVEQAFHAAFGPYRVNPKREFFEIEPEQAIALLRLMAIEDVTPEVQREADNVDRESKSGSKKLKSRRPNLNFTEMGIPFGSTLRFARGDESVEVINDRQVRYNGGEYFLSTITKQLLGIEHNVAPNQYWQFNGRSLREIYNETYEFP